MIEVMVTILVASFGLLALAGLMMSGIQMNTSSFMRSVATQQAYDIADRMRANIPAATAGNYDNITYTANQVCGDCKTSSCAKDILAAYDACIWNNSNETALPLGRGTVTRNGNHYIITVSWDDSKSGTSSKSFITRFEP